MRKYPNIFLLSITFLLFIIDVAAFFGLLQLSEIFLAQLWLKALIYTLYWLFSGSILGAIVWLTFTFPVYHSERYRKNVSYVFALAVLSFLPKLIFILFLIAGLISRFLFEGAVIITIAGFFVAAAVFAYLLYGVVWEKRAFKVKKLQLFFHDLPPAFNGYRIVQISDAHLGSFGKSYKIFNKAIRKINELKPDIICFTGDMVNHYADEAEGWEPVFQKMKARKGKYAVLGNHDYGDYSSWPSVEAKRKNLAAVKDFITRCGFRLLLNESAVIEEGSEKIAITGIENWGKPPFQQYGDLQKAVKGTENISFKILLSHDPSHWDAEVVPQTEIQLTLSGHTHGMQFGIGWGKRKWSPAKYRYPRWGGLYQEAGKYLYINRGLGFHAFPGRVNMPPEITLIELYRQH